MIERYVFQGVSDKELSVPARTNSIEAICNNGGWWVDWLDNTVMVIGSAAEIKAFRKLHVVPEKTKDGKTDKARFPLNRIMPVPKGHRGMDRTE